MRRIILFLTVFLPAYASAQMVHSGTGFFVSGDTLVTNAHVVKGCEKVMLKGGDSLLPAQVDARDETRDLALIKTEASDHAVAPMRFGLEGMQPGEKAYILGYPGLEGAQGKYKFIDAEIRPAPPGVTDAGGRFYISDSVTHGNSGGPVFDTYGNVIGVVVAGVTSTLTNRTTGETAVQRLGVVISLTTVKEFLSANNIYTQYVGSGSATVDPTIEDDAKAFIVNVQCRPAETP